jgi:hypothetical protein
MEKCEMYISINRTVFELRSNPARIIEQGKPENTLEMNKGQHENGCFAFQVDDSSNKLLPQNQIQENTRICRVPVRFFKKDILQNQKQYQQLTEKVNEDESYGFKMLNQILLDRINGILPKYHIGEVVFLVDGQKEILIPADGKTEPILYSSFEPADDEDVEVMYAYYDQKNRKVLDHKLIRDTAPEGIFHLTILGPSEVDPIGRARKGNNPDLSFINFHDQPCVHKSLLSDCYVNSWGITVVIEDLKAEEKKFRYGMMGMR